MENRLENVELVHWLGALFVITGHMYVLLGRGSIFVLFNSIHRLGVLFFFVCGGYVVSGSWDISQDLKAYFIKRIARIFPALVVVVVCSAFLIGPVLSSLSLKEYFTNALTYKYLLNVFLKIQYFLPGVFETNIYPSAVNGSLWTLPIEFMMYIIIPIYSWLWNKVRSITIVLTFMICALLIVKELFCPDFYFVIYGTDMGSLITVVPFYFIGMMLYHMVKDQMIKLDFFSPNIALVGVLVSCIVNVGNTILLHLLSMVVVPYIVLSICRIKIQLKSISKYSVTYGMYLWGFLVQQVIIMFNQKYALTDNVNILLAISILVSFAIAMFSYHFVERPFIRLSKKWK